METLLTSGPQTAWKQVERFMCLQWGATYGRPVSPESHALGNISFLHAPVPSPSFPLVRLLIVYTAHLHFLPELGAVSVLLAVSSPASNACGRCYIDIFGIKREIKARTADMWFFVSVCVCFHLAVCAVC